MKNQFVTINYLDRSQRRLDGTEPTLSRDSMGTKIVMEGNQPAGGGKVAVAFIQPEGAFGDDSTAY
jgi:hypothetical protein